MVVLKTQVIGAIYIAFLIKISEKIFKKLKETMDQIVSNTKEDMRV